MDRETKHELDSLLKDFVDALDEVRFSAFNNDREVAAWRKVQVCGWAQSDPAGPRGPGQPDVGAVIL